MANLDGSNPHILVPAQDQGHIASEPRAVAVDASHIYWSDAAHETIDVANLDGTDPHPLITGPISALGVAVDAGQHLLDRRL